MKNPNASSFSSESDDDDSDSSSSSSSTGKVNKVPSFSSLFNQEPKEPPAPKPQFLNLFEAADAQAKREKSESDEADDDDSDAAPTPSSTVPRQKAARSFGSLLRNNSPSSSAETPSPSIESASAEAVDNTIDEEPQLGVEPSFAIEDAPDGVELPVFNQEPIASAEATDDSESADDDDASTHSSAASVAAATLAAAAASRPTRPTTSRPSTTSSGGGSGRGGSGRRTGGTGSNGGSGSGSGSSGGGTPPPSRPGPGGAAPVPPNPNTVLLNVQHNTFNQNQAPAAPNTIIERHDSSGAALAFLGALYLNRRRKKDIKSVRRDLKDTNKQAEAEQKRTKSVESANRTHQREHELRTAALESNRTAQERINAKVRADAERAARLNTAANILSTTIVEQSAGEQAPVTNVSLKNEQTINNSLESTIIQAAAERVAVPMAESAKEIIQQAEQSQGLPTPKAESLRYEQSTLEKERQQRTQEQPQPAGESQKRTVNETVMSKRREAADDKAAAVFGGSNPSQSQTVQAPTKSLTDQQRVSAAQRAARLPFSPENPLLMNPNKPEDIYKQSMQAGFMIGIGIVVLGTIAYFLMR